MQGFLAGVIVGGAIAAAGLIGYAYGEASHQRAYENNDLAEMMGQCRVQVGFGRTTSGDSCFGDEVMVGRRNDRILCADISVSCN